MSNQDAFRKVGRGGAGNFYTAKPVDAANKDLEAARTSGPDAEPDLSNIGGPSNTTNMAPGQYIRAGRGGAGNFYDPKTARDQQDVEDAAQDGVKSAQPLAGRMALGGRGGAGNYHQKKDDGEQEKEKARKDEMEKKVVEEVEDGLASPPKAFLGNDRKVE